MFASRFVSSVLLFCTLGAVVASPVPAPAADAVAKRADTPVADILDTLKATTDGILPQIAALGPSPSSDTLTPLVTDLTSAFATASSSIAAVTSTAESAEAIGTLVAGIITDVATTLGGVLDSPALASLLPGLDSALDTVLKDLEVLLAGVLNLVATLLVDVAGILRSLALGLTLGSLGL